MNVFEHAKQMERDGIDYYQKELDRAKHPGFKRVLTLLVNEEKKHYDLFDLMERRETGDVPPEFPKEEAKNVFQLMRENKDQFDFSKDQIDIYEKALDIERESEDFYRDAAEKADDQRVKNLILRVADEERNHFLFVKNLVDYLRRPEQWVEHAMFTEARDAY